MDGLILAVAVVSVLGGLVVWLVGRSVKRWPPTPPGKDETARQAEARLWSTKNGPQA